MTDTTNKIDPLMNSNVNKKLAAAMRVLLALGLSSTYQVSAQARTQSGRPQSNKGACALTDYLPAMVFRNMDEKSEWPFVKVVEDGKTTTAEDIRGTVHTTTLRNCKSQDSDASSSSLSFDFDHKIASTAQNKAAQGKKTKGKGRCTTTAPSAARCLFVREFHRPGSAQKEILIREVTYSKDNTTGTAQHVIESRRLIIDKEELQGRSVKEVVDRDVTTPIFGGRHPAVPNQGPAWTSRFVGVDGGEAAESAVQGQGAAPAAQASQ